MAQYDVTAEAKELLSLGWTNSRIEGLSTNLKRDTGDTGDTWTAWNRRAQEAISEAVQTAQASPQGKARRMLDAVRAGQTCYTKAPTGWQIVGPYDVLTSASETHTPIQVTKASGDQDTVTLGKILIDRTVDGVHYATATFTKASAIDAMGDRAIAQAEAAAATHDLPAGSQVWDNA